MPWSAECERGKPILTGLIGIDIQGSRSPAMHMGEAAAQQLCLTYELFDLGGGGEATGGLARTLDAVQSAGFAGVNITHPFKQQVIGLLDELSEEARLVGAVNTIVFRAGRRIGYNTDAYGFARGIERQLPGADLGKIVQVGAGGAGAATAVALGQLGAQQLVIIDPRRERAEQLAARVPGGIGRAGAEIGAELVDATGLVNASPIGMEGHPGSPVSTALLHAGLWVADVVYFPLETELLRAARAIGCRTAHGGDMAVFQAARAFDLFTGRSADRDRMIANF